MLWFLPVQPLWVVTGVEWGSPPDLDLEEIPLANERKCQDAEVRGMAWFKGEATHGRAPATFTDSGKMPAGFEDRQALVDRELELIQASGDITLRADIDPETFSAWCASRGFEPNSQGRMAFVNQAVLAHRKTG